MGKCPRPTPSLLRGMGNGQYQTSDEEEIRKERYRLSFRWTGWLGQDGCYRLQVSQDLKFQTIAGQMCD